MISATAGTVRARTAPLSDRAAHDAAEALGQQWFGPNFDEARFDEWAQRVEHLPDRILLYADDGEAAAVAVHQRGLKPETVLVRRSSLEDVFLRLTGRSLID